jgi:hypothetical protein
MNPKQLLHFLRASDGSVARLNNELALLAGFKRINNPNPASKKKALWFDINGKELSRMPDFTGSIDEARHLMDLLFPGHAAAISENGSQFFAAVNDGAPAQGATLPLAMCIATLEAWVRRID